MTELEIAVDSASRRKGLLGRDRLAETTPLEQALWAVLKACMDRRIVLEGQAVADDVAT